MAALDFGMALARGMLPKAETAQKDLLNLAGGRNVFKSEDWWNKTVDKQISKGMRKTERVTYYLNTAGEYVPGVRKEITNRGNFIRAEYEPPGGTRMFSDKYRPPGQAERWRRGYAGVKYVNEYVDATKRKDFTAGELTDIEASAKSGVEQIKRTSAESKASQRRLKRATGGLMGKARQPGEEPSTGLPALGEGGLGITGSILGGGIKL